MTKKTGPVAAAMLASLFTGQAMADAAGTSPQRPAYSIPTITSSFCAEGMPQETAYINISYTGRKPGADDLATQNAYRSDIVKLTRDTWRSTMRGSRLDEILYRRDVYDTQPERYRSYSPEKEKAFWEALQVNLKKAFDGFRDNTGVDAQVSSTLILIQPGCMMGS
jgi:hypothetical protein